MTHSPWWSWEAREDTWRQSSPGWTFSCAASTTPASCQQGQSWAPQFRQIGCQCQGWVAWRKRGQPTEGRGQGWGQLQDRQGKPIQVHSSRRPQPPHLSSVPCSPGWRRWRWPKRSLWRCWWCRRPGRPCGSCGGTCCSCPGQEELQCQLHKSRRSECLRLGSEHYCCGCYRRTSLQLLKALFSLQVLPRKGNSGRERWIEMDGGLTDPNLRLPQSLPLRSEQELQSVASTLHRTKYV